MSGTITAQNGEAQSSNTTHLDGATSPPRKTRWGPEHPSPSKKTTVRNILCVGFSLEEKKAKAKVDIANKKAQNAQKYGGSADKHALLRSMQEEYERGLKAAAEHAAKVTEEKRKAADLKKQAEKARRDRLKQSRNIPQKKRASQSTGQRRPINCPGRTPAEDAASNAEFETMYAKKLLEDKKKEQEKQRKAAAAEKEKEEAERKFWEREQRKGFTKAKSTSASSTASKDETVQTTGNKRKALGSHPQESSAKKTRVANDDSKAGNKDASASGKPVVEDSLPKASSTSGQHSVTKSSTTKNVLKDKTNLPPQKPALRARSNKRSRSATEADDETSESQKKKQRTSSPPEPAVTEEPRHDSPPTSTRKLRSQGRPSRAASGTVKPTANLSQRKRAHDDSDSDDEEEEGPEQARPKKMETVAPEDDGEPSEGSKEEETLQADQVARSTTNTGATQSNTLTQPHLPKGVARPVNRKAKTGVRDAASNPANRTQSLRKRVSPYIAGTR